MRVTVVPISRPVKCTAIKTRAGIITGTTSKTGNTTSGCATGPNTYSSIGIAINHPNTVIAAKADTTTAADVNTATTAAAN